MSQNDTLQVLLVWTVKWSWLCPETRGLGPKGHPVNCTYIHLPWGFPCHGSRVLKDEGVAPWRRGRKGRSREGKVLSMGNPVHNSLAPSEATRSPGWLDPGPWEERVRKTGGKWFPESAWTPRVMGNFWEMLGNSEINELSIFKSAEEVGFEEKPVKTRKSVQRLLQ